MVTGTADERLAAALAAFQAKTAAAAEAAQQARSDEAKKTQQRNEQIALFNAEILPHIVAARVRTSDVVARVGFVLQQVESRAEDNVGRLPSIACQMAFPGGPNKNKPPSLIRFQLTVEGNVSIATGSSRLVISLAEFSEEIAMNAFAQFVEEATKSA